MCVCVCVCLCVSVCVCFLVPITHGDMGWFVIQAFSHSLGVCYFLLFQQFLAWHVFNYIYP